MKKKYYWIVLILIGIFIVFISVVYKSFFCYRDYIRIGDVWALEEVNIPAIENCYLGCYFTYNVKSIKFDNQSQRFNATLNRTVYACYCDINNCNPCTYAYENPKLKCPIS
jgi:hypothetical protein